MIKLDSLCSYCSGQNAKKCFGILGTIFFLFLIIWLGVDLINKIKAGSQIEAKNTITVSATGEVYSKPDLALTSFSVVTTAKTVADALAENTQKMNAVIEAVKAQGVEDKDLKTVSFNIYPKYEWYNANTCLTPCPNGRQVLVGYEVSQSLQVKIRDLTKVGAVIETAAQEGANQISGLQFTIDNEDALQKEAREKAILEARTKAKELAKELDVRLGRVTNFSEASSYPYYYRTEAAIPSAKGGGDGLAIETGENKIEVSVTITYEIR
jgi:hypothetical protein